MWAWLTEVRYIETSLLSVFLISVAIFLVCDLIKWGVRRLIRNR
ncbi:membrane protein [Rhodococcus phage Finch]|uniref:Membrane protein n=1 Tax=Rhodococcus phage Finch TaxID=2094144 RepID=A0A2P1JXI8_9CAUD|nr:membrane protein [Rhodococcus phage Finch]AVO25020.1 membrane protein [Rhodococcus phage Finch]